MIHSLMQVPVKSAVFGRFCFVRAYRDCRETCHQMNINSKHTVPRFCLQLCVFHARASACHQCHKMAVMYYGYIFVWGLSQGLGMMYPMTTDIALESKLFEFRPCSKFGHLFYLITSVYFSKYPPAVYRALPTRPPVVKPWQ